MKAWMMIDYDGTWELDTIQRTRKDCIDYYIMHGFYPVPDKKGHWKVLQAQGWKCVKVNIELAEAKIIMEHINE